MSEIFDIKDYQPSKNEGFFFDTNVWLYITYPAGDYDKEQQTSYSDFMTKILSNGAKVFITPSLISEFCNRYLRNEFYILKQSDPVKYKDFKKDFRPDQQYKESVIFLQATIKAQLLKLTTLMNFDCTVSELETIINKLYEIDFNDTYYSLLAKKHGYKIVTHDYDFVHLDVPVCTSNPNLLRFKTRQKKKK
ncbi:MAG: PIN domain-containing protein [Bacteroidota bacterium]|nr:PIN domain-containing protein [Bacteroidota bacterium]